MRVIFGAGGGIEAFLKCCFYLFLQNTLVRTVLCYQIHPTALIDFNKLYVRSKSDKGYCDDFRIANDRPSPISSGFSPGHEIRKERFCRDTFCPAATYDGTFGRGKPSCPPAEALRTDRPHGPNGPPRDDPERLLSVRLETAATDERLGKKESSYPLIAGPSFFWPWASLDNIQDSPR